MLDVHIASTNSDQRGVDKTMRELLKYKLCIENTVRILCCSVVQWPNLKLKLIKESM